MVKLLVTTFLSILASFSTFAGKPTAIDSVFICTGSSAHTYHTDRSCRGLVKCGGKIVSLPASVKLKKRRICKICNAKSEAFVIPAKHKSGKAKPKAKTTKATRKKELDPLSRPVRNL